MFLVGDSNAGHFTEPVARAANQRQIHFTVATNFGCPFVDLEIKKKSQDSKACRRFVKETVAELKQLKPELVIISSAASIYINDPEFQFGGGNKRNAEEKKARLWTQGLSSILLD